MAAVRGVSCGEDLEVIGGPRHHAFLAVESILGPHAYEAGVPAALRVVGGLVAAHRPSPWRQQRRLITDSLTNDPALMILVFGLLDEPPAWTADGNASD
jgi:hypothetical protein